MGGSEKTERDVNERSPVAWIFGAGITGLTAAHELVERGYEVYVVEPADDPWEPDLPAVGGVARTQWGLIPPSPKSPKVPTDPAADPRKVELTEAVPMLRHPVLEFDAGLAPDELRLHDEHELRVFADRMREVYGPQPPPLKMRVTYDPMEDPKSCEATLERVQEFFAAVGLRVDADPRMRDPRPGSQVVRVEMVLEGRGVVPGEHGFRYFPGFYRHLFDTMRRTTLLTLGEDRHGPVVRSAFDNLVCTEATWLVVKREGEGKGAVRPSESSQVVAPMGNSKFRLVRFPRRPPRTPQQILSTLSTFVKELGYGSADLARLSLKLFQYMTSSTERRAAEYEDSTWWEFIGGEKFSPICRDHMERGPEVLGAMTATESDTRTQGNMVTQLLLDQLVPRDITDATLNGPTSSAWFDIWREYLVYRGVKFFRGRLEGFDCPESPSNDHRDDVLLPRVRVGHRLLDPRNFTTKVRPHYFVLAVPLTAMMGFERFVAPEPPEAPEPRDSCEPVGPLDPSANPEPPGPRDSEEDRDLVPGADLAERFLRKHRKLLARLKLPADPAKIPEDKRPACEVGDFAALRAWSKQLRSEGELDGGDAQGTGPLRHLTGVQFFFSANLQFGQEHTLYMESGWRLSSISQAHFWNRRPTGVDGYRGVVSVDIGALFRPLGEESATAAGLDPNPAATMAWNLPRSTIARAVWLEVAASVAVDTSSARNRSVHAEGRPDADAARSGTIYGTGIRLDTDTLAAIENQLASQGRPTKIARPTRTKVMTLPTTTIDLGNTLWKQLPVLCYYFDQNVRFRADGGGIERNLAPYLINRPGEWRRRPGLLRPRAERHQGYVIQNRAWLLAGTYMKTFTRLTTMEAANESARHAVNAILEHQGTPGDRCMVWDPEEYELPEFDALQELDRRLFEDGYPHMVEILGLEELPLDLLPQTLGTEG